MQTTRRTFVIHSAVGGAALAAGQFALAQPAATLSETDPQAMALGYKADAAKADKTKYPKRGATDRCGTCALYQGKAGDAAGPCPLYGGKQVAAKGWCSAWAKKG